MIRWLVVLLLAAGPAVAADSMNIAKEQPISFTGTVVDLLCEVAKRCEPDCGGGKRQLGLKTADGRLVVASKSTTLFAGTTRDLASLCGQPVIVDGIMTTGSGTSIFMVQYMKLKPSDSWHTTEAFLQEWASANHVPFDGKDAEVWFRNDAMVRAAVAKRGRLGIPER